MQRSILTGSPFEQGCQCGAALKKSGMSAQPSFLSIPPERMDYARACLPLYERYLPEVLAEMRGMAQSLEWNFDRLAGFLLGMYSFAPQTFCTCVALRDPQSHGLLGRNSDFSLQIKDACASFQYRPQGGPRFAGNTTAFVQLEDGMNEHGLAAGLTLVLPDRRAPGLNAGMLVRYFLQNCDSVQSCLQALPGLPIGSAQCIALADRKGDVAVIECSAAGCEVLRPHSGGYVWATNGFHSPRMAPYSPAFPDEIRSDERWQTAQRALAAAPVLERGFLQDLLAGKHGFMCQYDAALGMDTLWSCVYDATAGEAFFCPGNPDRTAFAFNACLSLQ